ncbi:MAG: nuclear transport factor 2 family protein [Spirochaetaceae bacterium]|nr:nuclear transport factor 2 family protein [Spirochaetaceae bacterium]
MAASNDHIRQTIERYVAFMNAGDADSIAALYAEDATLEDPIGTDPIRGREKIRAFYAAAAGAVRLELTGNPRVAAGEAAFPMRANLGPDHAIEIIDVMAFDDDGLIRGMRAFWSADAAV